ncbi:hypothetical protein LENED_012616 [Lentinula edodes]|uniref:Uncharacterized protein n=1 Tax=Lentinula edodes TaxID=5353 RepID=A0A1Q3ET45_LENED|nr:hypothetical protein LENED_012616 [Lentinula edodes]
MWVFTVWSLYDDHQLERVRNMQGISGNLLESLVLPHTVMAYIMEDISPSGKGNQRQLRREGKSSGGRVESSSSFQSSRPEASSRLL